MPLADIGDKITSRPVHFIWILDTSGSMGGAKLDSLNWAIRNAIPEMRAVAAQNAEAQLLVRAVKFNTSPSWHMATPVPIDQLDSVWTDVGPAEGLTEVGKAFDLVSDVLKVPPMQTRALPPVLALVSDGEPTDGDWQQRLDNLMKEQWAQKAIRIVIGIGHEAESSGAIELFQRFVGNAELYPQRVFFAKNVAQLATLIRWATTVVVANASVAKTAAAAAGGSLAAVGTATAPIPPPVVNPNAGPDVW